MKTRNKVILDEWLGKSAVVLLNLLARLLGKILSIDHTIRHPRRIVVCKFLGMGSIIQATPLLQTLKENFPAAEITFITSVSNVKLLESIHVVDRTLAIDDRGFMQVITSTFRALRQLWKNKADLYIDLETYSFFSTALATMSCSTNRFGFYRIERNIRMGVYTHMMFFNARAAIAQSYLQMARLAGCTTINESLYNFKVKDEDKLSCGRKIIAITGSGTSSYVIINPNASDLRVERRWPAEKFVALIHSLRNKYPEKTFLLIGAGNEFNWVKSVYDGLDENARTRVFNTAGLFSLYELFSLIENSELVITNDTGPMHISFAYSRPTISLFGPASPSQYGQNPNSFGIYKNIYCSPCVHDFLTPPCHGDNQCMKKITVEEVLNLCDEIFAIHKEGKVMIPPMQYLKNDGVTSLGILERRNPKSNE
jgi:ADP-heptose:LPS heptosyltransferase